MSNVEAVQVVLRLTSNKALLDELRRRGALKRNADGQESYVRQFDALTFEFQPGRAITVGKMVAQGLIRDSWFVMGDALTGEVVPALEEVKSFDVGKGLVANVCSLCNRGFDRPTQLASHILREHGDVGHEETEEVAADADAPVVVPDSD